MLKIASNQCKICAISRGLRARQNLCAIFERKRFTIVFVFGIFNRQFGSIAQLGEHLPYKQGVIGSSPIVSTKRICESGSVVERCLAKANVASSNLVSRSNAPLAQLVEQLTLNQWVQGSSPCAPTTNTNRNAVFYFCIVAPRARTLPQGSTMSR